MLGRRSESRRQQKLLSVTPGRSRSKNGVALLAYVPGIHLFVRVSSQDVDGRNKSGHDERVMLPIPFE
jgi:hypothetical protein